MKLQTASRIAIYAVLELARDAERQLSAAEIGEAYGVSVHHLAKVLNTLVRAGLVRSVRGAGGGYMFTGNARRTTLLDVILLFEPLGETETGEEVTKIGRALDAILHEIDDISRATLNSVTLATVLKLIEQGRFDGEKEAAAASS